MPEFKSFQDAYIVETSILQNSWQNKGASPIVPCNITTLGKKYITVTERNRVTRKFDKSDIWMEGTPEEALVEKTDIGYSALLVPDEEAAKRIVRKHELERSISMLLTPSMLRKMPLDKLEAMRKLISD